MSDHIQDFLYTKLRLNKRHSSRVVGFLLKAPRFLASTLAATLGASIFTVPLVALHFQTVSLIAPLSNLLCLWAVAILFSGGLVIGIIGIFLPGIGALLALPFTLLARYLIWVVEGLARLPLSAISLDSFYYRVWLLFLCVLVGVGWAVKGKKRLITPVCAGLVTFAASVLLASLTFELGIMTAAVLDVGQGQSVLLRLGEYIALVDCGGDGLDSAGDVAADYMQSVGRTTLDLLVVSHYHTDHANGIAQLLKRVDISVIALPDVEEQDPLRQDILALAQEKGIEVWFVQQDTHVQVEESQHLTIYPPMQQSGQSNELGLSVLASTGTFDVLLTSDMGQEGELLLLEHTKLPKIELLVAGHHGSKGSTTQELLQVVRPELAAISVGKNNRYGHPAQQTLERLDMAGAEIYRTDLHGTVTVYAGSGWAS